MLEFDSMRARVENLMTAGVVSLRADTSLAEAARTLACHAFGALPVVDVDDVPIGIVSETDMMRVLLASAAAAGTVREFMSTPVEVIDEMAGADEAIRRMLSLRIHHLPVVRSGKLVGMVTPGDVVRWFVNNRLDSLTALA
jgi:CBS domain-containing protein